jgi:hypothetical protein
MRYLLLIYGSEQAAAAKSADAQAAEMDAWWKYTSDLQGSGHHLGGDALQPIATATTVRLANGRPVIADGPFAETKEQLGGFYMIDVPDLDAAIAWAAKMPNLPDGGSVEIRPIMEFDASES